MRKFLLCTLLILLFSCQASAEPSVIDTYGTRAANAGASLTVSADAPPVVTTQPINCFVNRGDTAMFSVTAVGSEPLTYQWQRGRKEGGYGAEISYFGWSDISGANSAVYSFTAEDDGVYRVLVSNSYGSVISDVIELVLPTPPHPPVYTGGGGGCNSIGGVLGIITLFPVLLIFCRKKN